MAGRESRGAVLGSARGSVSQWPLWELPRWLQVLVVAVVTVYCGTLCAAVAATPVQTGQLRLFAVLLTCSAAAVELTRRTGEHGGVVRDVYAIWELPAAVLLPPVYALLAPLPRMALTQVRVRRTILHRRAYATAVVGLAYAAASLAFHAAAPSLGPGAGTGTGGRAMLWTVLAAGCGLLRLVVNDGLVLTAVKGSTPDTRLLPKIAGAEALYGNVAELSLGTLSAFATIHATLAIVYALPLVVSLQRSLRHAHLVAEARVDGKTGVLNDKTWRRQAAGEVARAARTRTPVAVGILDIDHFKKVNDTYGHPTGDAVLAAVAAAVTTLLRDYDIIGRVGGEEFGFVLPNSPLQEAVEVAERLREAIPGLALQHEAPPGEAPPRVTVSIGMAVATRPGGDLGRYYSLADQALYAAKHNGRDAVWVVQADQAADPRPRPSGAVRGHAGS
jgi:diguanylate cyclase (GGDEF)-like protein